MPYQGEWLIPLRVMGAKGWGAVTLADLDQHTRVCLKLLKEVQAHAPDRKLHMLFDASEAESLPPMYLMVPRAIPVLRYSQQFGVMFFVSQNHTFKSIINLTAHVMHFQVRIFTDKQEALNALEAYMVKEATQVPNGGTN